MQAEVQERVPPLAADPDGAEETQVSRQEPAPQQSGESPSPASVRVGTRLKASGQGDTPQGPDQGKDGWAAWNPPLVCGWWGLVLNPPWNMRTGKVFEKSPTTWPLTGDTRLVTEMGGGDAEIPGLLFPGQSLSLSVQMFGPLRGGCDSD